MFRVAFGLTLSLVLLSISSANAALVFEVFYRIDGVDAIDTVIKATPGQMFSGEVVIRETVTNPDVDVSELSSGLISFSADLATTGGDATFSGLDTPLVFSLTSLSDADTASGFVTVSRPPVPAAILPTETSPNIYDFAFATFNLTAPSSIGQATLFTLADSQPLAGVSNFETFAADIDDGAISFRGFTISTAAAIPEPSSITLLSGVTVLAMYRLRRKRTSINSLAA